MGLIKTAIITLALGISTASSFADDLRPASIDFGLNVADAHSSLADHCNMLTERQITPAQLPGTKESQIQFDCEGFSYFGKPRLAEFVFRDGALALVWILTDAAEETAFEEKMIRSYGTPSHTNVAFTAFTKHRTALRKDKAEVLFYAKELAPMFNAWFDSAANQ